MPTSEGAIHHRRVVLMCPPSSGRFGAHLRVGRAVFVEGVPQIALAPGAGWGRRLSRGSSGWRVGEETRFAGSGWSVGEEMRFADPQGVRHALSARGLVVELCWVSSCALLT